ncbi:MAG TPA: hypothetical protein VK763_21115 [Terriglobales bacterium]|jgi:hypothetical protein|nr:hypothetical protein [Terriglobales bacterium]
MTIDDVRIFADVTTRQAEEAFRKQMDESDRRIDAHVRAARLRYTEKPGVAFSGCIGGQSSFYIVTVRMRSAKEINA